MKVILSVLPVCQKSLGHQRWVLRPLDVTMHGATDARGQLAPERVAALLPPSRIRRDPMGDHQRLVLARQLVRGGEPCGRGLHPLCGLGGEHSTPPVEREGRVPASGG